MYREPTVLEPEMISYIHEHWNATPCVYNDTDSTLSQQDGFFGVFSKVDDASYVPTEARAPKLHEAFIRHRVTCLSIARGVGPSWPSV